MTVFVTSLLSIHVVVHVVDLSSGLHLRLSLVTDIVRVARIHKVAILASAGALPAVLWGIIGAVSALLRVAGRALGTGMSAGAVGALLALLALGALAAGRTSGSVLALTAWGTGGTSVARRALVTLRSITTGLARVTIAAWGTLVAGLT